MYINGFSNSRIVGCKTGHEGKSCEFKFSIDELSNFSMWLSKSDRNDWVDAFSFSYRGVEFEVGAFRILFEEGGLVSEVAELIVLHFNLEKGWEPSTSQVPRTNPPS